ncbi:MAG: DnaJ domain-containing protein [Xenococcus sp. MO_188.B8]|nr:DnaJ domain-containing protein [Xenococcus sp. MO_188.B8]
MGKQRDYYLTLKISPKATPEEIKISFRRLARQYHPDLNPENPEAAEYFKAISEAYETLSDPLKRRRYDRDRNLTNKNYSTNYNSPEPLENAQNAQYYYLRGIAQGKAKQYQGAIAEYSKAIAADPQFIDAYIKRSEMRYKLGDSQGVLDDCYWVIKINSSFAKAYYYQGRARYSLGYVQASIDSYSEAIRQNKDYAQAYYYRGIAYGELQDKSLAIQDLHVAAKLFRFEGNKNACHLAHNKIKHFNQANLNTFQAIKLLIGKSLLIKIILLCYLLFMLIILLL